MPLLTDMPPAHVDGTLYWLGRGGVIVAFNISARAFDVIQLCEQGPNTNDHAFLVELNNTVSLVVADGEAEEMEIWMMDMRLRAWVSEHYRICLRGILTSRPGLQRWCQSTSAAEQGSCSAQGEL
jgi:hypothetical protein